MSDIGKWAFYHCSLVSLSIPNSVRHIGKNAFSYCKKLKTIYLPEGIRVIGENPFIGCENLQSIVVPRETQWWYEHLLPDDKDKIVESMPQMGSLFTIS